ncbi:MAG: hypothetical protein V3V10_10765 [Planctomycetota bacterium]
MSKSTKNAANQKLAVSIVVLAGAAILFFGSSLFQSHDNGQLEHPPVEPFVRVKREKYEKKLWHMQEIASAMRTFRSNEGGGVRFPNFLEELVELQLLPEGFDLSGPFSGSAMSYDSFTPAGENPSTWVVCFDAKITSGYNSYGRRVKEVDVAVVILGDGTARLLTSQELTGYGGVERHLGFAR